MWMLELFGISIVGGVVLGVAWRLGEDWLEKRELKKKTLSELSDL